LVALLLVALSACAQGAAKQDREPAGSIAAPKLGACRVLTPHDVDQPSNDSPTVGCDHRHTAETFTVGTFPKSLADGDPDSPDLGAFSYQACSKRFQRFLGGEESSVMRSTLTWAWFRPSRQAWHKGARWYRCDVVGGGAQSQSFVNLPETAKGLLLGKPADRWMICVNGPSVTGAVKIPCTHKHTWRAVTTIVLGQAKDKYPGDRLVEVRTRDFCSDSVGAWMNYPVDYDFGYTWFHEAEWKAGNRRSICWARTDQ
jgi:hypothetical protein